MVQSRLFPTQAACLHHNVSGFPHRRTVVEGCDDRGVSAYQDESNWTGWIWEPGALKAGLQREAHSGSLLRPYVAKNLSDDFYDHVEAAEPGRWYSLEITVKPGSMSFKLTDKAGGQLLLAAANDLAWEGPFIALGSRKLAVSFDNVTVRSTL